MACFPFRAVRGVRIFGDAHRARTLTLTLTLGSMSLLAACVASVDGAADEDRGTERDRAQESATTVTDPALAAIAEKDLAVAWELTTRPMVTSEDVLRGGDRILPPAWYTEVERGFRPTSVGDALAIENRRSDWRMVSMRVAPCSPIVATPSQEIDTYCWPEVRLVWQPILRNVRFHERFSPAFADDRALHALYDAPDAVALTEAEAARARTLRERVTSYADAHRGGPFAPLSAAERAEFEGYRDRVASALLRATLALRGSGVPASRFSGFGVRPESVGDTAAQEGLRTRTLAFLGTYARPTALKKLTAFSLPEGREPAHLNEWVFLSFKGVDGRVVQESITMTSARDGRTLVDFGTSLTSGMATDDARVVRLASDPTVGEEIRSSVIVNSNTDEARLIPVLRDRRARLVPNTTCASCHRMNPLRFDFHNFGYLEDRDLTISPRVRTDVELDLAWVARLAGLPPRGDAGAPVDGGQAGDAAGDAAGDGGGAAIDAGASVDAGQGSEVDAGAPVDAGQDSAVDAGAPVDAGQDSAVDAGDAARVEYRAASNTPIPDNSAVGIRSTVDVPDDVVARSVAIRVAITHPYRGDLIVRLLRGGQSVVLANREGGNARNLEREFVVPAFAGQSARGPWTLEVQDRARGDVGRLDAWSVLVTR
jgi:hypothetical protein